MASRGFSSDNLTLLLIAGAGVLFYQKFVGVADKVSHTLELGQNSGGPVQSETTEQISSYKAEVATWHCDWLKLPRKRPYYKALAMKLFTHVKDHADYLDNIDEDYLIGICKPLTSNELKAVAIEFGVKDINNALGFTAWTGHIFHFFDEFLSDSLLGGNDLTAMKKIWAPTGFWV